MHCQPVPNNTPQLHIFDLLHDGLCSETTMPLEPCLSRKIFAFSIIQIPQSVARMNWTKCSCFFLLLLAKEFSIMLLFPLGATQDLHDKQNGHWSGDGDKQVVFIS